MCLGSMPAAKSASTCRSRSCLAVDTLALTRLSRRVSGRWILRSVLADNFCIVLCLNRDCRWPPCCGRAPPGPTTCPDRATQDRILRPTKEIEPRKRRTRSTQDTSSRSVVTPHSPARRTQQPPARTRDSRQRKRPRAHQPTATVRHESPYRPTACAQERPINRDSNSAGHVSRWDIGCIPDPHPERTGSQIRTDESTLNTEHNIWDNPASVNLMAVSYTHLRAHETVLE